PPLFFFPTNHLLHYSRASQIDVKKIARARSGFISYLAVRRRLPKLGWYRHASPTARYRPELARSGTHEQGIFRKHGLDSNLVYIRSGTTAVHAVLAGEIQLDPQKGDRTDYESGNRTKNETL